MRQLVVLLTLAAALSDPARATWLQCTVNAMAASGAKTVYLTSVAPVSDRHSGQPNYFPQRLQHYIATQFPESHGVAAECTTDTDQLQAIDRYETNYTVTSRKFGWENTHIITPGDWLADDWLVTGQADP